MAIEKQKPILIDRKSNGETEIVTETQADGSQRVRVEGPFHVDNSPSVGSGIVPEIHSI